MPQRLLEGDVIEPPNNSEPDRLREVNRTLARELHEANEEIDRLRQKVSIADAPIARLREKLGPFYKLLQTIFGDIDELVPEDDIPASAPNPKAKQVWDSWKTKMPGVCAEIIDALLVHSEGTAAQLAVMTKHDKKTIYNAIYRMRSTGLLDKNGGKFSLKQL